MHWCLGREKSKYWSDIAERVEEAGKKGESQGTFAVERLPKEQKRYSARGGVPLKITRGNWGQRQEKIIHRVFYLPEQSWCWSQGWGVGGTKQKGGRGGTLRYYVEQG